MKTHTKHLVLTAVLLGMLLTVFTATTVMASTNGVTSGDQQHERVQDCDQTCQNDGTCPTTCNGAGIQQQHQDGSTCANGCTGDAVMQQTRSRHQYQYCMNQES